MGHLKSAIFFGVMHTWACACVERIQLWYTARGASHLEQWCIPFSEGCSNEADDIQDPEVPEGRHKGEEHQGCTKGQLIGSACQHAPDCLCADASRA